jgi:hypothetical protein
MPLLLGMLNLDAGKVKPRQGFFRRTGAARSENDWARIRKTILNALRPFPGAREAVVSALKELCSMDEESDESR